MRKLRQGVMYKAQSNTPRTHIKAVGAAVALHHPGTLLRLLRLPWLRDPGKQNLRPDLICEALLRAQPEEGGTGINVKLAERGSPCRGCSSHLHRLARWTQDRVGTLHQDRDAATGSFPSQSSLVEAHPKAR